MDLEPIIDEIAGRADDFLADVTSRREAQAGIAEMIDAGHPHLASPDRKRVVAAVMSILEEEDFFSGRPNPGGTGPENEDEDPDVAS